jgi:hypothetical protein
LFGIQVVHFIHIGKTAGTAIKVAVASKSRLSGSMLRSNGRLFIMHGHNFTLAEVSKGEQIFFVVRDPIKRFESGFYSRKRMGKPRNYNPWTEAEKASFTQFETTDELAQALNHEDSNVKAKAEAAMRSIGHVNSSYWNWFISKEILDKNLDKILVVLCQENLDADYELFRKEFKVDSGDLPKDEVSSHRNPSGGSSRLSSKSIENLMKWYARDYEFLEVLFDRGLLKFSYTKLASRETANLNS